MKSPTIIFTPDKLRRLKAEYAKHASDPTATFKFEGNELLVAYCKYMIDYLETKFPNSNERN